MSFSFEFNAKITDVPALLEKQTAPDCVKDFIRCAVEGLPGDLVQIKAYGHLFARDYQVSTANITVQPIIIAAVAQPA